MKNKYDFILSDESLNAHGLIVKTDGINTEQFLSNPIMPFNHNLDNILGRWINLTKTSDLKLIATAEFDIDDPESVKIQNKVDKELIKGVSVGLDITDFEISEDKKTVTVLTSNLLEASITSLPSNKNAIKLSYNNKDFNLETGKDLALFLSDNSDNSKTIEKMKMKTDKPVKTDKKVEPTKETKTVETVETKVELAQQLEILLSVKPIDIFKTVENLTIQLSKSNIELEALTAEVSKYELEKTERKIDLAITAGKFTLKQKDSLLKLSNDILDNLIENARAITTPTVNLNQKITDNKKVEDSKKDWTLVDWLTKDREGLDNIKLNNEELYNKLYNARYSKTNK